MNELDKKFPLGDRAWFELAVGARPLTPKEEQKLVKEWPVQSRPVFGSRISLVTS